jgi:copper chaperone CopZ
MSKSVTLQVSGMKCGGCENNLTTKLSALNGIFSVKASHQDKQVHVDYNPDEIDIDEIEDTITDAGFTVES